MFWPTAGMFCSVLVAHMLFCLLQVAACTKNTKSSLDESEHKSSTNNLERVLLTINFNRDQFAIRSLLVITDKEAVQFYLLVFFWTIKWVEFTNKNVPFFFLTKYAPNYVHIWGSLHPWVHAVFLPSAVGESVLPEIQISPSSNMGPRAVPLLWMHGSLWFLLCFTCSRSACEPWSSWQSI